MTPRERKQYVNQDQVRRREYIGPPYSLIPAENGIWPDCNKSDYRVIYEMYFLDFRDVGEISQHVKLSESQIYHVITRLRNNYVNHKNKRVRKILRLHFIDREKVMKIARETGVAHSYVSKIISKYLLKQNIR